MRRISILIPILSSLAALVLVLLALLAGVKPGTLENFDIITFNTSALGQNVVSGSGNVFDQINDITGNVADQLAERLGIHEFYSLHALTICNGDYKPDATAKGADKDVDSCRSGLKKGYNISSILDTELRAGPLSIDLADLGFTEKLQDAMNTATKFTKVVGGFFIASAALIFISLLASIAGFFMIPGHQQRFAFILNVCVSMLPMVLLGVSSILITVGSQIVEKKVNDEGEEIGLRAKAGTGFLVLIWIANGLVIFGGFGFWVLRSCTTRPAGSRRASRGYGYGGKI